MLAWNFPYHSTSKLNTSTWCCLSYSNKPPLTNRTLKRSATLIFYVLAKSVESWTRPNVLTPVYANAACLDLWTLLDHSFVVTHNLLFRPNFRSTNRWAPPLWSIIVNSCIRLKLLLLWVHYTVEDIVVNTFIYCLIKTSLVPLP